MTQDEIITHLTEHGCEDLTSDLDPTSSSPESIAHGGFGFVYTQRLRDGRQVAIKALRVSLHADDEVSKLPKRAARELYAWSMCRHPNVLPLLGLARFQDQIRMVSPWMENGSLPAYLDHHPDLSRCDMCLHVCNGLEYLHSRGVIHGDLKGNNVLVSGLGIPLITDFGNAVLEQGALRFTATATNMFTIRWAAPEILDEREVKQSKEADVFALGMTILVSAEIITGEVPYFYITNIVALIKAMTIKKETPKRPEEHIPSNSQHGDALWSLLLSCWELEPETRPGAAEVAEIVRPSPNTPAPDADIRELQMKGVTREGLMLVQA